MLPSSVRGIGPMTPPTPPPLVPAPSAGQRDSMRNGDVDLPIIASDLPVMYEDEGQEEMGDSQPHTRATEILSAGLAAHLAAQPGLEIHADLNLYYHYVD